MPICSKIKPDNVKNQGLRAMERPHFGAVLMALVSYSAENVTSDLGLHSRWLDIAILPSSENLVFIDVRLSILWMLPKLKLFWKLDNLCVISAATSVPVKGLTTCA